MSQYTLFFPDIITDDLARVGGKGHNLAAMVREDLLVPPGFCITTAAYREFIAENRLQSSILMQIESVDAKDIRALHTIATKIQKLILNAVMPEIIADAICIAHHRLCEENSYPLAVRSSAIAEDTADASFAGQHDTFLGIVGTEELLANTKKCWASLWTPRVIQYRQRMDYSHREAALAVVVQQMIPCEVAGVLFTINPLHNQVDEMVIDATWGLGEALVSGTVDADNITVAKVDGAVKEYRLGRKHQYYEYHEKQGITVQETGEKATQRCLEEEQIHELIRLGKAVESTRQIPQDIEWGWRQGRFYLLQTRPITTFSETEEQWTADNAQEAFPKAVSPFTTSFLLPLLRRQLNSIMRPLGIAMQGEFARIFDGYVYLNVTMFEKLVHDLFPGGVDAKAFVRNILSGGKEGKLQFKLHFSPRLAKAAVVFLYRIWRLPAQEKRSTSQFLQWIEQYSAGNIEQSSIDELQTIFDRLLELCDNGMTMHMHGSMAYFSSYSALNDMVSTFPRELEISPAIFTTALGTLEEARMKRLFTNLATAVRANPEVAALVIGEDPASISQKLQQLPQYREVHHALDEFLRECGHLGDNMAEISALRWCEDCSSIWKLVKVCLAAQDEADDRQKMVARRLQTTTRANQYLSRGWRILWPLQRIVFSILVRLTTKYVPYRENTKFHFLKGLYLLRRIALRWGEILCERGYLQRRDDIFYLSIDEIKDLLASKGDQQTTLATVAKRREEMQCWQDTPPPRHIYIRGERMRKVYDQAEPNAECLTGIPGSSGRITGTARVIFDLAEADKFNHGEILVTRFTDPSWTPLFSLAGAVVVDIGSMLSHGAVVARELGIPAVVGIRFGTEVIVDGQEITVDGDAGVVWLGKGELE